MTHHPRRLVVAAVLLLPLVAACDDGSADPRERPGSTGGSAGFADLPAQEIVATAKEALLDSGSLTLRRDLTADGATTGVELRLDDRGNCTGTIEREGGVAEILGVDGSTWFKPDAAFWVAAAGDQADAIVEIVGDRWVPGDFESLCDLESIFEDDDSAPERVAETVGTDEVEGQGVVTVRLTDDEGTTSVAQVLLAEPHHLVRLDIDGASTGRIELSGFGVPVEVEALDLDDIVSLSELEGVDPDMP